jgi:hypothetical protein
VLVEAMDPVNVTWLDFSGYGGGSTLLTGLRAYYALNETSGTAVADALGVYNATTNAAVGQSGKFGYAETFTKASSQYINAGTSVADVGTNDFMISCWIYIPTLQSAYCGIWGNYSDLNYPYFYLNIDDDNYLGALINFDGTDYKIGSNAALSATTMYNVIVTFDRGGLMSMIIDGVTQTDTEDISAKSAISMSGSNVFTIGQVGLAYSNWFWSGMIDDWGIWEKVGSAPEVTDLQTKYYPFN